MLVRPSEVTPVEGWQAAASAPGECPDPSGLEALEWLDARVPGTAAAVLAHAGQWRPGEPHDFDAEDWWFTAELPPIGPGEGDELVLRLDGIATVHEVFLDDEPIAAGQSMFQRHVVGVGSRL